MGNNQKEQISECVNCKNNGACEHQKRMGLDSIVMCCASHEEILLN